MGRITIDDAIVMHEMLSVFHKQRSDAAMQRVLCKNHTQAEFYRFLHLFKLTALLDEEARHMRGEQASQLIEVEVVAGADLEPLSYPRRSIKPSREARKLASRKRYR